MSDNSYYILYLFDTRDYPRKQSKVSAINLWRQAKVASSRFHDKLGHACREHNSGVESRAADDDTLDLRSDLVFGLACIPRLEGILHR